MKTTRSKGGFSIAERCLAHARVAGPRRTSGRDGLLTGFTIIEILVVISVISILSSFLLPALLSSQKKAKIARTQVMVDSLTTVLKQYRTDFGAYPPDDTIPGVNGETSSECLYYYATANFVAGNNSDETSAGPYMELHIKEKIATAHTADWDGDGASDDLLYEISDTWGNPIIYQRPGANNVNSFDIYSIGPDETAGNGDDIKNW